MNNQNAHFALLTIVYLVVATATATVRRDPFQWVHVLTLCTTA